MKHLSFFTFVIFLLASGTSSATTYTDVSDFILNAGSLDFEGFEDLTATNSFDNNSFSLSAFEMTTTSTMGVFSGTQGNGTHPTDGDQFVHHFSSGTAPFTVTFTFSNAITAFGLTTTDWAELLSGPDLYVMTTNAGDYLSITDSLEPPGAELFSGVVNLAGFTSVVLAGPWQGDAFGIDSVYFSSVPAPEGLSLLLLALGMGTVFRIGKNNAKRFCPTR
jgi:hypothetical protein